MVQYSGSTELEGLGSARVSFTPYTSFTNVTGLGFYRWLADSLLGGLVPLRMMASRMYVSNFYLDNSLPTAGTWINATVPALDRIATQ
jgi:hypothetical protein